MRPAIKLVLIPILGVAVPAGARAAEAVALGASTCSSSGCHGGAGDRRDQFVVWSQRDVHSKTFATLTTARSARMAEALAIANPAKSPRCVVCHAPLAAIDPASLGEGVEPSEGVSCVSCHDMPAAWIRGHTRPDWTHADRVSAGMRDLNDLYSRANTCVACHQNVDPALVSVGHHPALIFELDGQTQDEPKHWRDDSPGGGAQAWFVGQAVALREVSWALLNGRADPARSRPAWQGLVWLLSRSGLDYRLAPMDDSAPSANVLASAVETADQLARRAAQSWEPQYSGAVLRRLAATQNDFLAPGTPPLEQACRAERLVLALDRLLAAVPAERRPAGASAALDRLFALAQSQPDFDPVLFAGELGRFASTLSGPGAPPSG
jgi:hypothetical protein